MYLGLDLGTSGLKAQVIDESKKVVFEKTSTFDFIKLENGATEQDSKVWIQALESILNLMPSDVKRSIKGISFSGQMHGSVFMDKQGQVIRNVILWNDQRTIEEVNHLNAKFPLDTILKKTGNVFLTGFTAPKVLWLKNNESENFNKLHKVILPKDYLIYMLTGEYASDYSDSIGTAYLNIFSQDWDEEVISELGITKEQLPKLYKSDELVATISEAFANKYGINKDAKVFAGGGDNPIGAIGVGMVNEGDVSCSFGTSGVVFSPTKELKVDSKGRTHSFMSSTGEYYLMGVSLSTAASINWLMNNIYESNDFDKFFGKEMFNRKPTDIIFTPYLNGERTPHFDSNVRASFLNVSINNDNIDIARSVLEGIIFSLKDSLNILLDCGVKPKNVIIQGGVTTNEYFNQLVADVFGFSVSTGVSANGPAYGAAIVAYSGVNNGDIKALAAENMAIGKEYKPRKDFIDFYNGKYKQFTNAYNKIK